MKKIIFTTVLFLVSVVTLTPAQIKKNKKNEMTPLSAVDSFNLSFSPKMINFLFSLKTNGWYDANPTKVNFHLMNGYKVAKLPNGKSSPTAFSMNAFRDDTTVSNAIVHRFSIDYGVTGDTAFYLFEVDPSPARNVEQYIYFWPKGGEFGFWGTTYHTDYYISSKPTCLTPNMVTQGLAKELSFWQIALKDYVYK